MSNREHAKKIEKYLLENGHVRTNRGGLMSSLDALTGDRIDCRLGRFKGQPAAGMIVGEDENLICLTRDFLELLLERSVQQTQLKLEAPDDDSFDVSLGIDPSTGAVMEATLMTIEGEELIELFLDNRTEPIVLEPGFLVEVMLGLYK